jgi:hypothetical protein
VLPGALAAQQDVISASELRESVRRASRQRSPQHAEERRGLQTKAKVEDLKGAAPAVRAGPAQRDFAAGAIDEGDYVLLLFGSIFAALPLIALVF